MEWPLKSNGFVIILELRRCKVQCLTWDCEKKCEELMSNSIVSFFIVKVWGEWLLYCYLKSSLTTKSLKFENKNKAKLIF